MRTILLTALLGIFALAVRLPTLREMDRAVPGRRQPNETLVSRLTAPTDGHMDAARRPVEITDGKTSGDDISFVCADFAATR